MKKLISFFQEYEKYIFLFIVLIATIPVLSLDYFVTHDGPAHLYNSNLINHLLFDKHESVSEIFRFTPGIVPNWIGHAFLCLLNLILPAAAAEKGFIVIYIFLYAYSFRALALSVNENAAASSYLIFPFIYSFPIHSGIYSFSIGVAVMLFVLAYFIKRYPLKKMSEFVTMILCMFLLYLSHLFVLIITLISITILIFWKAYLLKKKSSFKSEHKSNTGKSILLYASLSIIPLLLTLFFILKTAHSSIGNFPDFKEILTAIVYVKPLISLGAGDMAFTIYMFYVYVILLISACFVRLKGSSKRMDGLFQFNDGWLFLSLLMMLFYFVIPDNMLSGGVIGIRFCLAGYLFLLLFFAASAPKRFLFFGAIFSVVFSFIMIKQRYPALKNLSSDAVAYASFAEHIKEGSTLLPINYTVNWMFGNLACYIGSEKEILVLDNYEASQQHFPLQWEKDKNAYSIIGTFGITNRPCVDLLAFKKHAGIDIDYVLLMEKPADDSCHTDLMRQLSSGYDSIYATTNNGVLYQLKRNPEK